MGELRRWLTIFRVGRGDDRRVSVAALVRWRAAFPDAHTGALRNDRR